MDITYNDTKVGDQSEKDFVKEKVKEKNEGEAGAGDKWAKKWQNDKEDVFFPSFRDKLLDYFHDIDRSITLTNKGDEKADYLIRMNVEQMETGFYAGVVSGEAILSTRMFLKKKGSSDPLTILKVEDASSGEAITTKERLSNCYRNTAMHYGRWFRDKLEE